jgi:hypothetical protein
VLEIAAGIKHDPPSVALDEGDVRDAIGSHLEDTVLHLEQAVLQVELGIAPQARVDGVRRGRVRGDEGLEGLEVPDDVAIFRADRQRVRPQDQATRSVLEVLAVAGGRPSVARTDPAHIRSRRLSSNPDNFDLLPVFKTA